MPSLKPMLRHATVVLVVGVALAASFVGAFHDPRPHRMPVGVVAPAVQVARLDAGVTAHAPGALSLRPYPSAAAAATAIKHRAIDGAVVLGPARARLLVASAAGEQTVATIQRAFTPASMRMPVVTEDLAPLPASDRAGLAPFFFVLTLLIPSVLIGVALTVVVKDMPVHDRLVGAAMFAVALAVIDALLSNVAYGALGGGYLQLVGLGSLISFAASSVTVGLGRLLGPLGVALAVLGLLIVGVPASGAAVGPAFIPGFYAALHPILPMGQGLDAVRNAVYFSGHATADKLWLLGGWALLGIVLATIGTRWSLPELLHPRRQATASATSEPDAANMSVA
ncbi:MAG TPA: hypothetical protein VFW09_03715 [Solirubrobacteraceae bacterium]|nr:hypothetical protein [Solirubrobacteraceae bacterium]